MSFNIFTFNKFMGLAICLVSLSIGGLVGCAPSSSAIRDGIFRTLDTASNIGPHEITVDARNGVVTLTGDVASERDRMFVYNAARQEPGVVEVRDELHIRDVGTAPLARMSPSMIEAPTVSREDRELVSAIERNLIPISRTHNYSVKISARAGYVTATGTAMSRADADSVINAMRNTQGVREVTDQIEITPSPSDSDISRSLQNSFATDPKIRLQGLSYEVRDGIVTFTGRVNKHEDIDRILSKTLMVPGVREVRSNVTIVK